MSRSGMRPIISFLSTPSARRATRRQRWGRPRSWISIHALREEGDNLSLSDRLDYWKFLSTPSARRATKFVLFKRCRIGISIHALREEGDVRVKLPVAAAA